MTEKYTHCNSSCPYRTYKDKCFGSVIVESHNLSDEPNTDINKPIKEFKPQTGREVELGQPCLYPGLRFSNSNKINTSHKEHEITPNSSLEGVVRTNTTNTP